MPSRAHEARRVLLETIADAAGYRIEMSLPDGRRPDVLRVHVDRKQAYSSGRPSTRRGRPTSAASIGSATTSVGSSHSTSGMPVA